MKVVKRDGREEVYNGIKVIKAAESALLESGHTEEEAYRIACAVNEVVANNLPTDQCTISVKNIHILVEDALMDMGLKCAAREYIQYRQTRDNNREAGGKLLADISGFLDRTCDEFTKENANKPTNHVHTHRDLLAGILSKHLASTQILPDRVSEEHNKGFIHVHDLDYLISPLTNCFGRDTKFITTSGTKSFMDFVDGDRIEVFSHKGEVRKAVVRCYGEQQLNRVTLKRGRLEKVVYVTPNHRWLLSDGTETTSLNVGDRLEKAPDLSSRNWEDFTDSEKIAWCLGFGYADGVSRLCKKNGRRYFSVPLLGKKQGFRSRFEDAGFSVSDTRLYPVVHLGQRDKRIEEFSTNKEYAAYIDGILDADGHKIFKHKLGKPVVSCIQMTGEDINNFIEERFEAAGYYLGAKRDVTNQTTNFGKRNSKTVEYKLNPCQRHMNWKVVDIEPYERQDVWCLEVEEDHSFILSGGIVTGNCCLVNYPDMLENGFNIGNAHVSKPKSIGVATTILSQISSAVASAQYGGQTMSHIDHYLAQYAEATYEKNLKFCQEHWLPDAETVAMQMTDKDVFDSMQTLLYQINTLTSVNG